MIKLPNTLGFRLTLWYATAFLVCLVAAFLALYLSLNSILNSRMDDDLREDITEFQDWFTEEGLEKVTYEIEREAASSNESEIFLRLYDGRGNLVVASDLSDWEGLDLATLSPQQMDISLSHPIFETIKLSGQDYPVRIISGVIGPHTILQVGETLEKKEEIMELLLKVFAGMFFLGIPLASGIGWLIARTAVKGIEEVSRAVKDLEMGQLDRRVTVRGQGDEIQTLADSFNTMAARIKSLIHEMREMTDNIAHDLRSPLGRIRAMSEVALAESESTKDYKRTAADILKECDRLIHLINTTLDMAEVEAGVTHTIKEPINFSKLIADLCEFYEPVAGEKHIALTVTLEPNCQLSGDKQNLQRMVANLLDNAMKYTSPEGQIRVELTRSPQEFHLTIADTGVGIPLSDQQRVFDRFFRCDHSRAQDGCGLGLSFARSVARAHGGDIFVESESSQGSIFTSILPVTPSTQ